LAGKTLDAVGTNEHSAMEHLSRIKIKLNFTGAFSNGRKVKQ
jgi:hypothetical protein